MATFNTFIAEQNVDNLQTNTWSIADYYEADFTPVVFAIGKFNPPHIGHYQVVQQLVDLGTTMKAIPLLFIIDTGKRSEESPLTGEQRLHYLRKMFPTINMEIATNAYVAITSMLNRRMLPVGEVTGSDRSYRKDIARLFSKAVSAEEVYVTNSILRDEELSGSIGASSTKMRMAVKNGDKQAFAMISGLPPADASELFAQVKLAMGL